MAKTRITQLLAMEAVLAALTLPTAFMSQTEAFNHCQVNVSCHKLLQRTIKQIPVIWGESELLKNPYVK